MSKNMTKKRKTGGSRRSMKRRREQLTTIAVVAFLFLCIGSFASMSLLNGRSAVKATQQWYVEEGEVEILAAPMANTLDRGGEPGAGLPFLQPTPTPTAEPAAAVEAAPAEEARRSTPVPLPTPVTGTAPTMEALDPEPTLDSVPITITAVGDCTLGGNVPAGRDKNFDNYVKRYGYDYFFENVRQLFESDDLTIVNLEGPLTTSDDLREGRAFNFRGKPEYVNILSGSSVEIANVANNHALDFGDAGFSETTQVLKNAGIGVCGFSHVDFREVKGVTVCNLGFTEWAYSEDQIVQAIELARPNCDLLLVSMHWGKEGSHKPQSEQRELGKAMVDAGADLVIGNHSHVYGGVELYQGKYIIYSLGNFCFGGNSNPNDKNCTIFQQTFNVSLDGGVEDGGISIIPARVSGSNSTNDFQPYILTGSAGKKLVSNIADVSYVDSSKMVWMDSSYQVKTGMVALSN